MSRRVLGTGTSSRVIFFLHLLTASRFSASACHAGDVKYRDVAGAASKYASQNGVGSLVSVSTRLSPTLRSSADRYRCRASRAASDAGTATAALYSSSRWTPNAAAAHFASAPGAVENSRRGMGPQYARRRSNTAVVMVSLIRCDA